MRTIKILSLQELDNAATRFLELAGEPTVIAFSGEMGAGKTTIIKAICEELGTIDTVTSPTFTLVNEYNTDNGDSVFHFDFYRIEKIEEVFDFGFEEYMVSGKICFMEWPEKIEPVLPDSLVRIYITTGDNLQRIIDIDL